MAVYDRPINCLDNIEVRGKRVLVRVDHNVPLDDQGKIRDDERIVRTLGTLRELASRGARVLVLSHLGYPGGRVVPALSTRQLADHLGRLLGESVRHHEGLSLDTAQAVSRRLQPGGILYLENTRFWAGEQVDSAELASGWAECGDLYVNEAFSTSHRKHASMHSLASLLPSCAGRQLERERSHLLNFRRADARRGMVLAGAKIEQKLQAVRGLEGGLDVLCLGGLTAVAITRCLGRPVGTADFAASLVSTAKEVWNGLLERNILLLLPVDWVVRDRLGNVRGVERHDVAASDAIIDVGPQTVQRFLEHLEAATSIFWNGPLGAYERAPGEEGSCGLAAGLSRQRQAGAKVLAGGGDTLALLSAAGLSDSFTFLSTGGGATIEFVGRGDDLPGLVHLFR